METTQVNRKQIDDLRAWFFAKDRSISLAQDTLYYLFTNQANGAYMSMAFISETVLSASAASVAFSNIPQNFRHLMLFTQARTDAAAESDNVTIRFNGDAGANYDFQQLSGSSTTAAASTVRGATSIINFLTSEGANSRAFNFAPGVAYIIRYSVSGIEKTTLSFTGRNGDLSADTDLSVFLRFGHWRNRNVITSITLLPQTGPNFVTNSRFGLYGVL